MFRKISNIIIAVFLVGAIGILAVVGIPIIMGNKLYAVLTESMVPTYPVGCIVVIKPSVADEIQENDVITFTLPQFDTPVTHRVIAIDYENQYFITKGDNNETNDPFPVGFNELEGKVQYSIPYLGNAAMSMRTGGGKLLIAWIVLILLALLFLPDILDKSKHEPEKEEKAPTTKKRKTGKKEEMRQRRNARYKNQPDESLLLDVSLDEIMPLNEPLENNTLLDDLLGEGSSEEELDITQATFIEQKKSVAEKKDTRKQTKSASPAKYVYKARK